MEGYERDRRLFHELVHVVYEFEFDPRGFYTRKYLSCSEITIEWLARQYRANKDLLRDAVLEFGLKPYVYDRVSYQAFESNPIDLVKQLQFPFAKGEYDRLRRVLMD